MDAARLGVHVGRERVRVALEPRHLAPLEHLCGQRMVGALGEVLEEPRARRPLPRRGLPGAGEAELPEQDVGELLRRADREDLARDLVHLGLDPRRGLGELARHAGQDVPVDRDPARLHPGEDRHERALQRLVDGGLALGREPGRQHAPEPGRDVDLLGRVFGRAVERHEVEAHRLATLSGDLGERQAAMLEIGLGELLGAVRREPGAADVERVGDEHRVVERRRLDPVPLQHHPIRLAVLDDLADARLLEERLQASERVRGRHLVGQEAGLEQRVAAGPVGERQVGGTAGLERERDPHDPGPHRVDPVELEVDRDLAPLVRRRDPRVQVGDRREGSEPGPVAGQLPRLVPPRRDERAGRHHGVARAASPGLRRAASPRQSGERHRSRRGERRNRRGSAPRRRVRRPPRCLRSGPRDAPVRDRPRPARDRPRRGRRRASSAR